MRVNPELGKNAKKRRPITGVKLDIQNKTTGQVIGDNIRRLRKASHLTQKDLAERLDTIEQTISKMERGIFSPSTENIIGLCQLFDVTPNDLMLDETVAKNARAHSLKTQNDTVQGITEHMAEMQQLFASAEVARDSGDYDHEAAILKQIIDTYVTRNSDLWRVAEWLNTEYSTSKLKQIENELRNQLLTTRNS